MIDHGFYLIVTQHFKIACKHPHDKLHVPGAPLLGAFLPRKWFLSKLSQLAIAPSTEVDLIPKFFSTGNSRVCQVYNRTNTFAIVSKTSVTDMCMSGRLNEHIILFLKCKI